MNDLIAKINTGKVAYVGGLIFGCSVSALVAYKIGFRRGQEDLIQAVTDGWVHDYADECPDEVEPAEDVSVDPEGGPEDDPFDETEEADSNEPAPEFVSYNEIIERSRYHKKAKDEEMAVVDEPEVVTHNVFSTPPGREEYPEWDYDVEDKVREANPDGPYVLNVDEFSRNDLGYRQETLTYYVQDDILADQHDTPVYNYRNLTGDLKFGYGSNDPNVVYIRNAGIRMEWEILFHDASFAEEVHGLLVEEEYEEKDLKHSADRKFRLEG